MKTIEDDKRNSVSLGNICVESNKFDVSELLGFIKLALEDKTIREYLQIFEKQELIKPDYVG
jgi:hypothetical protein